MSFMTAHRWNSRLCPPLGFLFNFALLWLILRRTPKEMRVHSRILLQTCAMDCLLLTSQLFGQVVVIFDGKLVVFLFDGYMVQLLKQCYTPSLMCLLVPIWFFLHKSGLFGVNVQFIYRYLVLNRDIPVTVRRYLLLLLPQTLIIAAVALTAFLHVSQTLDQLPIEKAHFEEFFGIAEEEPAITTTILDVKSALFSEFVLLSLLFILSNLVIVFCGWKMISFVAGHSALNAQLNELNRQLSFNLIILACIPFIEHIGSTFYFFHSLLDVLAIVEISPMIEFQFCFFLASHWLPVLNPLTSIFINRPYRDAVFGRFVKVAPMP